MFKVLGFQSEKTQQAYHKNNKQQWQKTLGLLFIVQVILFLPYELKSMKNGIFPWGPFYIKIIVGNLFFLVSTLGRKLALKRITKHQDLFIHVTDFIIFISYTTCFVLSQLDLLDNPLDPQMMFISGLNFMVFFSVFFAVNYNKIYSVIGFGVIYLASALKALSISEEENLVITSNIVVVIVTIVLRTFLLERSKRKTFEQKYNIYEKEKIWKQVLNVLPEGVLLVDKQKKIRYFNRALAKMLEMNGKNAPTVLDEIESINTIVFEEMPSGLRADSFKSRGTITRKYTDYKLLPNDEPETILELCEARDLDELFRMTNAKWREVITHFINKSNVFDENKDGKFLVFYGSMINSNGDKKTFEIKFSVKNFDHTASYLMIFSDITERVNVTTLKETINYKNQLLASVSHELRTPLNGNINFIQSAIDDPLTTQTCRERLLIPALRSAKYLLTLINDILDFSQMNASHLRLVPVKKSLVGTIKEAMSLIELQALRKKLYLKLVVPSPQWDTQITTDHNRLLQIIANLLSNALKFTVQGGITVHVKPESKVRYQITVEDTGIGIKEEDKEKIFKQYGKIDHGKNNTLNAQGVGLGLIISDALARKLATTIDSEGPGISFESEFGKGAKFFFTIIDQEEPLSSSRTTLSSERLTIPTELHTEQSILRRVAKDFTLKQSAILEYTMRNSTIPCTCPQILVADDDAFNQASLEAIMQSLKLQVESCYNGEEVLSKLRERDEKICSPSCQPFKMIFLDVNMRVMDGIECTKRLKKLFEENPEMKCPIIGCSGHVDEKDKKKALTAGMDDYCTKPISKAKIMELLKKYKIKMQS